MEGVAKPQRGTWSWQVTYERVGGEASAPVEQEKEEKAPEEEISWQQNRGQTTPAPHPPSLKLRLLMKRLQIVYPHF
ncbi:hypothetical protein R1flu_016438 [Riccia fluitans]|uniref:Uncharacterized protein n=1 Tax=Riccia fluitans TaxID=41844 RepID=A0ABD1YPY2_9MARC